MSYEVIILRRAQRGLARIPRNAYERVASALRRLAKEPRPRGVSKLSGREGWRIRVGDYRVIYEIDDEQQMITILDIGHRREIYR